MPKSGLRTAGLIILFFLSFSLSFLSFPFLSTCLLVSFYKDRNLKSKLNIWSLQFPSQVCSICGQIIFRSMYYFWGYSFSYFPVLNYIAGSVSHCFSVEAHTQQRKEQKQPARILCNCFPKGPTSDRKKQSEKRKKEDFPKLNKKVNFSPQKMKQKNRPKDLKLRQTKAHSRKCPRQSSRPQKEMAFQSIDSNQIPQEAQPPSRPKASIDIVHTHLHENRYGLMTDTHRITHSTNTEVLLKTPEY